jgi:hypothetical protein
MSGRRESSLWTLTSYNGGWDRIVAQTFGENPRTVFDLLLLFVCLRATCGGAAFALRLRCWADGEEIEAAVFESPAETVRRREQRKLLDARRIDATKHPAA